MPFRISITKTDVRAALDDQGYTTARAGYLDAAISSRAAPGAAMALAAPYDARLDVAVSSRADGAAYTGARAALLDNLDAAISSRPSGVDWTAARAAYLDATISSRADAAVYTAARAALLDNLDAAISSRATPGSAMALAAPYDARLDVAVSSRASPTDVDTQLGNRGVTSARMSRLDIVGAAVTNAGSVAAGDNVAGLTISLDTGERAVVEVRYSCGAAATFYAEGSPDNNTWYEGDTFSEPGAATNRLVGYLNAYRYFRFRSPTVGIDLSFEVRALL